MKVWICTQGEYSDEMVVAVFSKEEDARKAETLFGWSASAEEVDAIDLTGMPPEPGLEPFQATVDLDDSGSGWNYVREHPGPPTGWVSSAKEGRFARIWLGSFWARDKVHAQQIVKAKRDELMRSA